MRAGRTVRIARPTDNLQRIAGMYADGLGLSVLAKFSGHDGFDGVILGHSGQPYHLEFTSNRGHSVGKAPTEDHLLVFYIPDEGDWEATSAQMLAAGFHEVSSFNPFWEVRGRTFEDVDRYRVVLQLGAWAE